LPIRAFLHLDEAAVVDVLAFIPFENDPNRLRIGRKQAAANDPPESRIGIGAEVRPARFPIDIVRDFTGRGLMALQYRNTGAQRGLNPIVWNQTGAQ
jgi:hypothetical protein